VNPWHRRPPRFWNRAVEEAVVAAVPWSALTEDERSRLQRVADRLLRHVTWEAARGFALDDGVLGTIAGRAALLGMGLPEPVFPEVSTIVVHEGTITVRGPLPGPSPGVVDGRPLPVFGHTSARGPVFVAWAAVRHDLAHPQLGHDVVAHELAHKLDAEDGVLDGTPLIRDAGLGRRWSATCTPLYLALRGGLAVPLLDAYAAVSPSEFFAVATEVFLTRGGEMAARLPALFRLMCAYYGQDPSTRPDPRRDPPGARPSGPTA
jgi:Mlc titration factor MtfA (ptsG expression regulator)